jgi:glucose dehydrogenase
MLSAIDLITHKLVWTKRLGTGRDSGPMGVPSMLPFPMGTLNFGGSVTTRSGLLFIAAAQDRYLRAYDVATGEVLWKTRLPAGGQATPAIYRSPESGREFVVLAAAAFPKQAPNREITSWPMRCRNRGTVSGPSTAVRAFPQTRANPPACLRRPAKP